MSQVQDIADRDPFATGRAMAGEYSSNWKVTHSGGSTIVQRTCRMYYDVTPEAANGYILAFCKEAGIPVENITVHRESGVGISSIYQIQTTMIREEFDEKMLPYLGNEESIAYKKAIATASSRGPEAEM